MGGNTPAQRVQQFVNAQLSLETAAAGVSHIQKNYRRSLWILAGVVALVLLIACANVASLMTAQAAARAREMALRISIGAGRSRLLQLVLIESALIAGMAAMLGGVFAWWSAPFVVSMINPPDEPARLVLAADWRVLGFALLLTLAVTFLFGLIPALRASSVNPVTALRGSEDPHSRRRLMNSLVAAQVAFCFLVHFVAGLFVATFDRLSNQPTGFSAERVLLLETVAKEKRPAAYWEQVAQRLRTVRGVDSAALSEWALMSGNTGTEDIFVNTRLMDSYAPYFLSVSPGWVATMGIALIDGREFRPDESQPDVAIVNEAFARRYFAGENPVGKSFDKMVGKKLSPVRIVGFVRDARYLNMREQIRATVYVPFNAKDDKGAPKLESSGTFVVRTAAADPLPLAATLRKEVVQARSEFRVTSVRTQSELVRRHTIRERLLATLSLFFAFVALALAAVGLYGVLTYSVLQRRREIGIRMALGAQTGDVIRRVTSDVFAMLFLGALVGLLAGLASESYIKTLLFEVRATDLTMLAVPVVTIFVAAVLASVPPVLHAVRIDPATTLRSE